jgi:hypothetical protein
VDQSQSLKLAAPAKVAVVISEHRSKLELGSLFVVWDPTSSSACVGVPGIPIVRRIVSNQLRLVAPIAPAKSLCMDSVHKLL